MLTHFSQSTHTTDRGGWVAGGVGGWAGWVSEWVSEWVGVGWVGVGWVSEWVSEWVIKWVSEGNEWKNGMNEGTEEMNERMNEGTNEGLWEWVKELMKEGTYCLCYTSCGALDWIGPHEGLICRPTSSPENALQLSFPSSTIPDRIAHTTAFVTPVVDHWLEREIA